MDKQLTVKQVLYKYQFVALWGALLLLAYVVGSSFFMPKVQDVLALREEISMKEIELADKQEYAAYLERLEGDPIKFESDVVNYALPSKNDVISLIITYEGLGRQDGVIVSPLDISPGLISDEPPPVFSKSELEPEEGLSLDKVITDVALPDETTSSPPPPKPAQGLKELAFLMNVEAKDKETAIEFLKDVYKVRRMFTIDNMSWEVTETNAILMKLAVRTFYYPHLDILGSKELVQGGIAQETFINELTQTVTYDDYILDSVRVGKDNLFSYSSVPEPTSSP